MSELAINNYSNAFGASTLFPTAGGGVSFDGYEMPFKSNIRYGAISAIGSLANGILGSISQYKTNKAKASNYDEQAAALERNGQMLYQSAQMSAKQAEMAITLGKENSAAIVTQAGKIDEQKQYLLREANEKARARIGAGKTAYAASGILLEARADAAVAKWEQDEEANATLTKLDIMNQAENTIYNYMGEARESLLQGYNAAANYYGQASVTAHQATASMQEAARYKVLAEELRKKKSNSILGGILQAVCTIGGAAFGGVAGASIGSSIGGIINEGIQA